MLQRLSYRSIGFVFSFLMVLVVAVPAMARSNMPGSFADLVDEVSPAVVNISTTSVVRGGGPGLQFPEGSPFEELFRDFFNQQRGEDGEAAPERKVTSLGSGFVIDGSGVIVTNNHVIDGAEEIMVKFSDGKELPAEIVGHDPKTDIAVLRVKPEGRLRSVPWGDSDRIRVGDWVVAIGNPLGLGGTVTAGIVSARNRDINAGPYDDFIQTDAPINQGNSGGPLFDLNGRVVGINTAIISPNGGSIGIGFAVPSALARQVAQQLLEHGETRRGWLGVRIQTVSQDIADGLGMDRPRGALVAEVTEDGPSAKGGIEAGDVILSFDGKQVEEMRDLPRMVADTPIGKRVQVVVWRDEKRKTLRVKIGRLEEGEAISADDEEDPADDGKEPTTENLFGMTLQSLTPHQRTKLELDEDEPGVLVTRVKRGSDAEERGVRRGVLITKVAGRTVRTPAEVIERVEALRKRDRPVALFYMVSPRGEGRFVSFRLDNEE